MYGLGHVRRIFVLPLLPFVAAIQPAAAEPVDYSGLGLNTAQVRAIRAGDAKQDAEDRASFEGLWATAPSDMKAAGLPKSAWFAIYKWTIIMATIGRCSRFFSNADVQSARHVWDPLKGKNAWVDGLLQVGDETFQKGDAAGNDVDAPDMLTCVVALRGLQHSDEQALATLKADLAAQARP